MRITNSMMINNTIANISVNKEQLNTVNTQLATQKKISRPSDDPIIAIRALRLRTGLDQVTQYLEKNIPDASSWLKVTQGAVEQANDIVSDLYQYYNQGSTDTFAASERDTIANSLENLKQAYYSEGNVDYAGRYVFTGYKTDSSLTYQTPEEAASKYYTITQSFKGDDISTKKAYSNGVNLDDVDNSTLKATDIANPSSSDIYKITLGYTQLSGANLGAIKYNNGTSSINVASTTTDPNAVPGDDEAILNTSTGELLLGKNVYSKLKSQTDITYSYDKSSFAKGDVKPEHYFQCVDKSADTTADRSDNTKWINYERQEAPSIEYTINYAQTIKVNTSAGDVFNINLGRNVDEMKTAVQNVLDIESKINKLKTMKSQSNYADADSQAKIDAMLSAADKEHSLAKDAMKTTFEGGIKQMQEYQQQITTANSDVGNRITRLGLIESRLKEQQTNFKDLKSQNEDIDLEAVSINYSSAQLVYNASLAAAGKVVKQSLLDFL